MILSIERAHFSVKATYEGAHLDEAVDRIVRQIPQNLKRLSDLELKALVQRLEADPDFDLIMDTYWSRFCDAGWLRLLDEKDRRMEIQAVAEEKARWAHVRAVVGQRPRTLAILKRKADEPGSVYSIRSLGRMAPRSMKPYLEAMVVSDLLPQGGDYRRVLSLLPRIRKALGVANILDAYEETPGALARLLRERDPDRYY